MLASLVAVVGLAKVLSPSVEAGVKAIGAPREVIGIVIAIIPVFVFFRTLFGHSPTMKKAVSEFQKQIDYLVWMILFLIAVGLVYSLVNLFHPLWG